jgi:tRNA (cmo5U34)-methyltransferase
MSQFHFDPDSYLTMMREEVFAYDEFQRRTAEATTGGRPVSRILELGTGTGETTRRVLARHPDARLVGIDASESMLGFAGSLDRTDLRVGRLEDPLPPGPFDLVVAALVVHHLDGPGKRDLFDRVADVLTPGGRFVLADVIVPDRPEDAVTPLTPGFDLPDRVDAQLEWLAAAGFDARVVWARRDLVVVVAESVGRSASEAGVAT